jgi:hypothetical protein
MQRKTAKRTVREEKRSLRGKSRTDVHRDIRLRTEQTSSAKRNVNVPSTKPSRDVKAGRGGDDGTDAG